MRQRSVTKKPRFVCKENRNSTVKLGRHCTYICVKNQGVKKICVKNQGVKKFVLKNKGFWLKNHGEVRPHVSVNL